MFYELASIKRYLENPEKFMKDSALSEIEHYVGIRVTSRYAKDVQNRLIEFTEEWGEITLDNYEQYQEDMLNQLELEVKKIEKIREIKQTGVDIVLPTFAEKCYEDMAKGFDGNVGTITKKGQARVFRGVPFIFKIKTYKNIVGLITNRATLNYLFNSKYKDIFEYTKIDVSINPFVKTMPYTSKSKIVDEFCVYTHTGIFNSAKLAEFVNQ